MPELEDLRNRNLVWQADVLHRGRYVIYDGPQQIGHLQQESWWRGSYSADLGGLTWRLRYASPLRRKNLHIDFADSNRGVASAFKTKTGINALVDGVDNYRLERDADYRAVWRGLDGFVAVSVAEKTNEELRSDWIRHGPIRSFEVCPVTHAPILTLLSLVEILFNGFLVNQNYVPLDFTQG